MKQFGHVALAVSSQAQVRHSGHLGVEHLPHVVIELSTTNTASQAALGHSNSTRSQDVLAPNR